VLECISESRVLHTPWESSDRIEGGESIGGETDILHIHFCEVSSMLLVNLLSIGNLENGR
jgi:hypothetical protein